MRLIRNLFLLLSLFVAFHSEAQLLANQGALSGSYVSPISPRSFTTVTYTGSKIMDVYQPPGYANNLDYYPLIMYMPGYGSTDGTSPKDSFTKRNNAGEGWGQYLTSGDSPPGIFVVCPQNLIFNSDYGHAEWEAARDYMIANYRIDQNRMYATGLSGGAIGCENIFETETDCAAIISVSGPTFGTGWSGHVTSGIGFWQHHGANDGVFGLTVGGTLYQAGGAGSGALDFTPAPKTTYYFGKAHTSSVWSTEVYNRKERTDATGTAAFDLVRWLKKYSLDATQRATLFVENAEYTLEIVDYRESLALVNGLSSGSVKTALLSRLTTLKGSVDKGGTRYIVSCNATGTTVSQTGINDWNATFSGSQGISNLVDDTGGASTITILVNNQFATSGRDNNAGEFNAARQKYKGLKLEYNLTGLVISHSVTNGRITISNIPTGKKIDILLHHYHFPGDGDGNASGLSVSSAISATVNSTTTKTQYSAYQNAYYLEFDDVAESSGNVTLDMKTVSTRDVILQGFEILVHN